jgi:hypothetical protein
MAHGRGEQRLSASSGSTEEVVHLTYGDRTLTDGRGDPLHRAAAYIPDRQNPRTSGLVHSHAGLPCRAGEDRPFRVQGRLPLKPRRLWRRPDEDEERRCLRRSRFPAAQVTDKTARPTTSSAGVVREVTSL